MNKEQNFEILKDNFKELYPNEPLAILEDFIAELIDLKKEIPTNENPDWYKDAVVYSLYVDLFNKDFNGLTEKLDHIASLGVTCLWLLPILDSPMKDAGFDIKDYRRIRPELFNMPDTSSSEEQQVKFREFLNHAHSKGIRVIFDIAMNHCSMEHPWFQEARKGKDNPYRDYFIWNKDTEKYKEARLLFKGMCPSNWEKDGEEYFFHRFFEFQPDWNYRNPAVLMEMSRNIAFWMQQGVDGFRADAIPYLWKEEGTDCENLPHTHTILRFFRAVSEYLSPGTLLLAEACQKPQDVVDYIKTGDECNAAYHFPLMPQMFKALSMESAEPVLKTLSPAVTPEIPENSQWFTFLRCHDELSLELVYVDEADRAYIHKNYCHQPEWNFRVGEGISSRLSELFKKDVQKIKLAYSLMLSLPGTPVLYYGDEFGKGNDEEFYKEMIQMTGKDDTRFLVRGKVNWEEVESQLDKRDSFESQIFSGLSTMVNARNKYKAFGRGNIEWLENNELGLLSYKRKYENEEILVLINLSGTDISYEYDGRFPFQDILGQNILTLKNKVLVPSYSSYWISL